MIGPAQHLREEIPSATGALLWHCDDGSESLASSPVGGGRQTPAWVLNIGVPADYGRTDLDRHASEVTAALGLSGDGIALFTSAQLETERQSSVEGVEVSCTAGIGKPTFAASGDDGWSAWSPGTINIVASMPRPLSEAAAVNAVITITEAKTQALAELKVPGTGTATDAVVVLWSGQGAVGEAEAFCGPRSLLGSRLANATFDAVTASAVAAHPRLR